MPVQRPSNFGCFPNVSFWRLCGKLSGGETSHCFLMTNCTGIPAIPESSNSRCFECPERHESYSSQGSRIKYMLWFNFILGLNFIFLCFKLIIIHTISQNKGKNLNQGQNWTTTYTSKGETNVEKFGLPANILWDTFPPNSFSLLATDKTSSTPTFTSACHSSS